MVGPFLAFVLAPMVVAVLSRWRTARRRGALAAGRTVHLRGRLNGQKGHLLVDPRRDRPAFLGRAGTLTGIPLGGEALDATVMRGTASNSFVERVALQYRTPDGTLLRLGLPTGDAKTVGELLTSPQGWPAAPPRKLPVAPVWSSLVLIAALALALVAADVWLLGERVTADVMNVSQDEGSCLVNWGAGSARVDCADDVRAGARIQVIALPWPLQGDAVDLYDTPSVVATFGVGLLGLGLIGWLAVTPLAYAARTRRAAAAVPVVPVAETVGQEAAAEHEVPAPDQLPDDPGDLNYGALAAAARYSDQYRPGARVSPPRRATVPSAPSWALSTVLGTSAWAVLVLTAAWFTDSLFGDGRWRWYVCGFLGIVCLARIGWFAVNGVFRCRTVLRTVREAEARPMRYVRLHESDNRPVLVLFHSDGDDTSRPAYLQRISAARGSERRAIGGPATVGTAMVRATFGPGGVSTDPRDAALVCAIDGVVYLPRGASLDVWAKPSEANELLLRIANSHRRSLRARAT